MHYHRQKAKGVEVVLKVIKGSVRKCAKSETWVPPAHSTDWGCTPASSPRASADLTKNASKWNNCSGFCSTGRLTDIIMPWQFASCWNFIGGTADRIRLLMPQQPSQRLHANSKVNMLQTCSYHHLPASLSVGGCSINAAQLTGAATATHADCSY